MKAREVLRRYAAGERDFHKANLRGQSFKGQDLSGADFSEADIRGANFTNATLRGTNFSGAKAGLRKRWKVKLIFVSLLLSALAGFVAALSGLWTSYLFKLDVTSSFTFIPGGMVLVTIAVLSMITLLRGLGFAIGVGAAIIAIAGSGAIGIAVALAGAESLAVDVAGTGSLAVAGALATTVVGTLSIALALAVGGTKARSAAIVISLVTALTLAISFGIRAAAKMADMDLSSDYLASTVAILGDEKLIYAPVKKISINWAFIGALSGGFASTLLNSYLGWRTLIVSSKNSFVRQFVVALISTGGTAFCKTDLTDADFTGSTLKNTDFRKGKITRTRWVLAEHIDRARLGDSILSNPDVRELLVARNGYKKSYIDANLRGANLNGINFLDRANLKEANLKWADLSEATLHYADLRGADLTETLALGADFTGASLTGACLEAWNINYHTKLDNVDCQYVYLLRNQQERRPSSGDFAPGEFTKLFQEVLSTVDLIFRNGIDWKAFTYSFNKLVLDNEGTELSIQSIENKGDGVVVVRVNAPPAADKAKLHSEFNQLYETAAKALEAKYQTELQAKDDQITIYRQQSADMLEITRLMAARPINVQAIAEAKAMNDSTDQGQSFNVGGNFNIEATNSVVNLRDISGSVTNAINQLPDPSEPDQPNLKELLTELKAAIESDTNLPDTDKADLLEQVQELVGSTQTEEPAKKEGMARKAKKMFEATLKGLPDTAKIVEAWSKLLPLVLKALGLPA